MQKGLPGTIAMYSTVWWANGTSAGHQAYYAAEEFGFIHKLKIMQVKL